MRVFMLGWEFPPYISGGLGTACFGLTKAMDAEGVDICFVLPTAVPVSQDAPQHVRIKSARDVEWIEKVLTEETSVTSSSCPSMQIFEHVQFHRVDAALQPYNAHLTRRVKITTLQQNARHEAYKKKLREILKLRKDKLITESVRVATPPEPKQSAPATVNNGTQIHGSSGSNYEGDLMSQVHKFADQAVKLALAEDFDIIHAHDWMTFPAALAVKAATGKPLVLHVHSTEFDRSGETPNPAIFDIEKEGVTQADRIIAVSRLTANQVEYHYDVPPSKVDVIYNAVEMNNHDPANFAPIRRNEKIVLFLGRLTMQKGPEYFLQAAKKVVDKFQNVRFVVAGGGDMIQRCINMVAEMGLGRFVTFTGFLRGASVDRVFQMADLYVMPSVSEPFGIAPLEALSHNVPVLISKQSGVSEVLTHALKVDFWDIDEMANKILAVLRHEPLQRTLRQHGAIELQKISWADSAKSVLACYKKLLV